MAVNLAKLRNMTEQELRKEEGILREQIWKLRMQQKTGQLQDPFKVRGVRRDLARVMTVIRETEIAQAGGKG